MSTIQNQKYAHLFDTSQIRSSIKERSLKAGVANITSQGLSLSITLVRAAILARLLAPDDYGVFSMVVVVSSFALIFKDLGLGTATVREKEINHAQVSNLFWINTLLGCVSMLVVILVAPAIVWFYNDPRLNSIAVVLSVAFLFAGMSVQHQALLKRQMQFGKIARITVFSSFISSLAGIGVAWIYGNYWALVWMQVIQNGLLMLGFWWSTGWVPSWPKKDIKIGKFIRVGLDVAGLNAFSTVTQQIDKILIGRMAGATQLGLYNKGGQVPNLFSGQFRMAFFQVALPALSSLQDEKKRLSGYYYKFLNIVCWTTMPLSAFCFVFAEEIILVYFGPKWAESVIFMRILALHAFIMPAVTTLDQIPLALGHSRRYLWVGMVRSITLISCIAVAAPLYGVTGIALCVAGSDVVAFPLFARLCLKESPVSIRGFFFVTAVPATLTFCMAAAFYIFKVYYITSTTMLVAAMLFFIIFCAGSFLLVDWLNLKGTVGICRAALNRIRSGRVV